MMRRFDNRKVPQQEKFNENSGQDLTDYLQRFEKYCEENFKGDNTHWIGELERQLTGNMLTAFKSTRDVDNTYETAKKNWLHGTKTWKTYAKEKIEKIFIK